MLQSYYQKDCLEAGCDEAGRGCLAGPVFAAAVILPNDYSNNLLNDSKKLSVKLRYKLRDHIKKEAISYSVAYIDNQAIDEINILKASIKAMHLALDQLETRPKHIIIDGNRFYPYKSVPYKCIVKGDASFYSIAAASVLAKTYRDDYMQNISKEYPQYLWHQNKGYPTKQHREAIRKYGVTKYHRRSFHLLDQQLEIDF